MVTRGRGLRQTVTNGDMGEGVKNRDFYGDILFEWPLMQSLWNQSVAEIFLDQGIR